MVVIGSVYPIRVTVYLDLYARAWSSGGGLMLEGGVGLC